MNLVSFQKETSQYILRASQPHQQRTVGSPSFVSPAATARVSLIRVCITRYRALNISKTVSLRCAVQNRIVDTVQVKYCFVVGAADPLGICLWECAVGHFVRQLVHRLYGTKAR